MVLMRIVRESWRRPEGTHETVTGTFRDKLRAVGLPFEIELFHLSQDAHDQSRFQQRT